MEWVRGRCRPHCWSDLAGHPSNPYTNIHTRIHWTNIHMKVFIFHNNPKTREIPSSYGHLNIEITNVQSTYPFSQILSHIRVYVTFRYPLRTNKISPFVTSTYCVHEVGHQPLARDTVFSLYATNFMITLITTIVANEDMEQLERLIEPGTPGSTAYILPKGCSWNTSSFDGVGMSKLQGIGVEQTLTRVGLEPVTIGHKCQSQPWHHQHNSLEPGLPWHYFFIVAVPSMILAVVLLLWCTCTVCEWFIQFRVLHVKRLAGNT